MRRIMFVLLIALNGAPVALAQTDEERQACVNDALQLCQEAIPDRERVFGCLMSHKDVLSPACHAVMARSEATEHSPLKKQVPGAMSAKGKGTSAKRASKAMSVTSVKRASKGVPGTSAKRASKVVPRTSATRASKAVSRTSAMHASKTASGPSRQPLNVLPH